MLALTAATLLLCGPTDHARGDRVVFDTIGTATGRTDYTATHGQGANAITSLDPQASALHGDRIRLTDTGTLDRLRVSIVNDIGVVRFFDPDSLPDLNRIEVTDTGDLETVDVELRFYEADTFITNVIAPLGPTFSNDNPPPFATLERTVTFSSPLAQGEAEVVEFGDLASEGIVFDDPEVVILQSLTPVVGDARRVGIATYAGNLVGSQIDDNLDVFSATFGLASFQSGSSFAGFTVALVDDSGASADFNGDGPVNAADYSVWRDGVGPTDLADASGDGATDNTDYALWRGQFGGGAAAPLAIAIPEPAASLLAALAAALMTNRRRKASSSRTVRSA